MKKVKQKVWVNGILVDDSPGMKPDDIAELRRWKRIEVDCPYCLLRTSMDRFAKVISGTKKYPDKLSRRMMRCPGCGQGMRKDTLLKITNMSVEEFAYWFWDNVFNYRMMERVDGDNFFGRIRRWRYEDRNVFWAIYKEFKLTPNGKTIAEQEKEDADAYAEYKRAYEAGELDIEDDES